MTADSVYIDGSSGEGGGQILRTSLALAMITGRTLHMRNIRAGRAKPGLRRQHLACVEAAARLCQADVRGAAVSSQELFLAPGAVAGGELMIDIGTAGSTTLVVQTILVPAIAAGIALRAEIRGGTHNPLAPPFEFLERVWLPHLRAMGAKVGLTLDRHGFASGGGPPRGDRGDRAAYRTRDDPGSRDERAGHGDDLGGRRDPGRRSGDSSPRGAPGGELGQLTLTVEAGGALRPIEIVDAGPIVSRHAAAILARLPTHVAEREHAIVRERLGWSAAECEVREVRAGGPANVLLLEVERAEGRELITSLGEKGLRAETVAQRACADVAAFLKAGVPVGEHLADQLLLPMAVAGGGRFRTTPLSLHATTNIATIQAFLDVAIEVVPCDGDVTVTVGSCPIAAK
jgi:RNA 3'-terminal phosphate cyclase (ATP)